MTRLSLDINGMDAVIAMSDGNPGAVNAIIALTHPDVRGVDLDSALGPWGPVFQLDTHEIYGPSIYILWNDVCGRDAHTMLVLLRATQLGLFPVEQLKMLASESVGHRMANPDFAELSTKVCEQLSQFRPLGQTDEAT